MIKSKMLAIPKDLARLMNRKRSSRWHPLLVLSFVNRSRSWRIFEAHFLAQRLFSNFVSIAEFCVTYLIVANRVVVDFTRDAYTRNACQQESFFDATKDFSYYGDSQ